MPPPDRILQQRLTEVSASTLRLVARELAEGLRGGFHRAAKKGSGIEFAGHRPYTPGDDLRHLDRHSWLRHGRLMVREFHTDTERPAHVVLDASRSMRYPSGTEARGEPGPQKLLTASVFAAAITLLARRAGDPVGLSIVTDERSPMTLLPRFGGEAEQRILSTLEDVLVPPSVSHTPAATSWNLPLEELAATLPRGANVMVFSDFLDWSDIAPELLTDLTTRRRQLTAVQILAPAEAYFPFAGAVRLVDEETGLEVETDAGSAKADYLEALARLTEGLRSELTAKGARFRRVLTTEAPLAALRQILEPT